MTDNRLLQLARNDLASARDNLIRARGATTGFDATKEWGESGQTLNQIIAGYEQWEREALVAVKQAEVLD